MNSCRLSVAGVMLVVVLASAHAQDSSVDDELPTNGQVASGASVPEAPDKTEPGAKSQPKPEAAETFVPTEDISEDRSVSFPVDI